MWQSSEVTPDFLSRLHGGGSGDPVRWAIGKASSLHAVLFLWAVELFTFLNLHSKSKLLMLHI